LESGKTKMTSLDEIGIAVISPAIVGIGITKARVTRGLFLEQQHPELYM
jgi:hypothetical protein